MTKGGVEIEVLVNGTWVCGQWLAGASAQELRVALEQEHRKWGYPVRAVRNGKVIKTVP
jgi:hypothetical protein